MSPRHIRQSLSVSALLLLLIVTITILLYQYDLLLPVSLSTTEGSASHTDHDLPTKDKINQLTSGNKEPRLQDVLLPPTSERMAKAVFPMCDHLTRAQAAKLFPLNDFTLKKSVQYGKEHHSYTREKFLKHLKESNGSHIKIIDHQIYISKYVELFTRAMGFLHLLNEAIRSSVEPIPDIEFALGMDDHPHEGCWCLDKKMSDPYNMFLVPDFGFYSWPEVKHLSWDDMRRRVNRVENATPWSKKADQLFFRGVMTFGPRKMFADMLGDGKPWADVKTISWQKQEKYMNVVTMEDHCKHKMLAHIEGNTYSGRFKNLLLCKSLIVYHKLEFEQHFMHLLKSDGPEQNIIELPWDQFDSEMNRIFNDIKQGNDEKYLQIIKRNTALFRDKYLTRPAIISYARELIHSYASVLEFKPELDESDIPFEAFSLTRATEWDMH